MPALPQTLAARVAVFARTFLKSLLRLTWLTLPWMLLAAMLGAPGAELIPACGTHLAVSVVGVVCVAVLGTLLHVPMALDVALAYVLYRGGVPAPYVAALLCTLGPVSAYLLAALTRPLGLVSTLRLAGTTAMLGTFAGLIMMRLPAP